MAISLTAHTHRRASLARAAVVLSLSAGLLTAGWVAETQAAPVSSTSVGAVATVAGGDGATAASVGRQVASQATVAILPDDLLTTRAAAAPDRRTLI